MGKIKKIIEKYKNNEISDKKKVENLIYFLVMLVILVIGMNTIFFKNDKEKIQTNQIKESSNTNSNNLENTNNIEEKLEKILSKVKGVTNVNVMVTYESDKQVVPIYNLEEKETTTKETDSSGGIRDTTQKDYTRQVIFQEKGNDSTIVVEKNLEPKIAGVIVVANYNEDKNIKQDIISAVATASNISEYRVKVLSSN